MTRSLTGRRVAISRTPEQAAALGEALAAHGAELLAVPTIRILPADERVPLEEAAAHLERYDWIVLTSGNAGRALVELRLPPWPAGVRVAAIGRGTAESVERHGQAVALVPELEHGAALLEALEPLVEGRLVLFPCGSLARRTVPDGLRAAGAIVDEIVAYRTEPDRDGARRLLAAIADRTLDALILTSPSSAVALAEQAGGELAAATGTVQVVSVGPVTSRALRELGRPPDAESETPRPASLIEALRALAISD
jgi:uroporphyrinogen-III synthase